jgi:catechol 2,3-dioxygenase-like lactoylglutathione lyase family enzyme
MARVTGIGGIFFKSSNPASLRAWYRDTLGIKLESWGGAALPYDDPDHPPALIWSPFPQSTDYMAPSTKEFMINYAVDDLDGFLAMLKTKGVEPLKRDGDANGLFAWIMDPEGNKLELWEPAKKK